MGQYGDPEGIFSSVRMAAAPADVDAYRTAPLFAVSPGKLVVMSLCTLGAYEVYWAYKQWDAERRREHEDLSPFWRALFAPLWGFSLFPRIVRLAVAHGVPPHWSASPIALSYLLLELTWRLPGDFWLVSLFSFVPVVIVQHSINKLNAAVAPEAPRNDRFTGGNIAAISIGGVLLLFAILGTLLPPVP
jgi:hypothetical protein